MKPDAIHILILLLMMTHPAYSEESSLKTRLAEEFKWLREETYVWSASKHEQKTSEAPSLVTIVSSDDIKKFAIAPCQIF
ncbi:MAG: hypothetical protein HC887_01720 [Desulfobacteraceae bacterium]|nr:hypothetical protein [Desulfobacteraceae bacterium]